MSRKTIFVLCHVASIAAILAMIWLWGYEEHLVGKNEMWWGATPSFFTCAALVGAALFFGAKADASHD